MAKTITIFLKDGDPNGIISCEVSNWSGKAYKIPRVRIKECTDLQYIKSTGIYLLFGKNDEAKDQVYIGEAESILTRLNQHLTEKDFWNEAVVFIKKDENLNKAHIKYLENGLYDIAKKANRYKVTNSVTPTKSSLSESDREEMKEFIEYIKMVVNTLGHKVFDDKRELKPKQKPSIYKIHAIRGADGIGEPTSDGFVVFKGSKASIITVPSLSPNFIKFRQKLIDEGTLVEKGECYEFSDDYIFSSPSTAAMIILGRNANGLQEWKLDDGTQLRASETIENITTS